MSDLWFLNEHANLTSYQAVIFREIEASCDFIFTQYVQKHIM